MGKLLHMASRNLFRYSRRTTLTTTLIVIGILAVLLFVSLSGSFKQLIIGQITDSILGHVQIHKQGYVASIDNLPLNMMMNPEMVKKAEAFLGGHPAIEAYSPRVKFGAMFSNFEETTNIRLNGVVPAMEDATCPMLKQRLVEGAIANGLIEKGKILIPDLLAKGMKVKVGDTIVLVATNQDGAVNGQTFVVQGVLEGVTGPGGRDGYIHIDDARSVLRMNDASVSEYAVRLKDTARIPEVVAAYQASLGQLRNQSERPVFELHTWEALSPFYNIARMIDLMTLFIKIMLVAIVLISVMNVMVMAVYERIREIGTMAAIGTPPQRILGLFVAEGLLLGLFGSLIGSVLSLACIFLLQKFPIHFDYGRQTDLVLVPEIAASDVIFIGVIVTVIAVLASIHPAWKASRMDPIKALRSV
jgi:putative ABC transport system permease protein